MSNAKINAGFLASCTPQMQQIILSNIAGHYGITAGDAKDEVTDPEAENIMDYVAGPQRSAIAIIYRGFLQNQ